MKTGYFSDFARFSWICFFGFLAPPPPPPPAAVFCCVFVFCSLALSVDLVFVSSVVLRLVLAFVLVDLFTAFALFVE